MSINKNYGTLIVVAGLPGSGKTTLLKELLKNKQVDSAYDDYQGEPYNNSEDPKLSKHYHSLVTDLTKYKKVAVADIRFCIPAELNLFLVAVLLEAPHTKLKFLYFINDPESCIRNIKRRNRKQYVDTELEFIKKYSKHYKTPLVEILPVLES